MKLAELHESKEVNLIGNLIGKTINNGSSFRLITSDTPNQKWDGAFLAGDEGLTSLFGAPKETTHGFACNNNHLKSLEHAPQIIGGNFSCSYNEKLTNLKDIHNHIKEIGGLFFANNCPIVSNVLGLLKIKRLKEVEINKLPNNKVENILNKYLKEPFGNGRVMGAQSELLDAEFDEYAQL